MKIKILALALTFGILGAIYMIVVHYYPAVSGAVFSGNEYGGSLRFMMQDLYPFYKTASGVVAPLVGAVLGFIDGFVFGLVTGALYNALSSKLK